MHVFVFHVLGIQDFHCPAMGLESLTVENFLFFLFFSLLLPIENSGKFCYIKIIYHELLIVMVMWLSFDSICKISRSVRIEWPYIRDAIMVRYREGSTWQKSSGNLINLLKLSNELIDCAYKYCFVCMIANDKASLWDPALVRILLGQFLVNKSCWIVDKFRFEIIFLGVVSHFICVFCLVTNTSLNYNNVSERLSKNCELNVKVGIKYNHMKCGSDFWKMTNVYYGPLLEKWNSIPLGFQVTYLMIHHKCWVRIHISIPYRILCGLKWIGLAVCWLRARFSHEYFLLF